MKTPFIGALLATALLVICLPAAADDTDLFVGTPPSSSVQDPNLLILIDNTSNWSAANQKWPDYSNQGEAEMAALQTVIGSLAPAGVDAKINVGFMMLSRPPNDGAYVRFAVKPMTVANRTALQSLFANIQANITDPSNKTNSSAGYDTMMYEAFKYYGGYTSPAHANDGVAGTPVDTTHFGALRRSATNPLMDNSAFSDSPTDNNYIPISNATGGSCSGKNFIVLIGNGTIKSESVSDTLLANVGANTSPLSNLGPEADLWSRFLYTTDVSSAAGQQNVVTYTVDVYNAKPSANETALLKSTALHGGGKYFLATTTAGLVTAFSTIFSEIQAVNSVFASVSLPVSVSTQGTYLNHIYIGMFRPDLDALPRWNGNLKQYKLGLNASNQNETEDANGTNAINSSTGFITQCARSYWTPTAVDTYWAFNPQGGCITVANSNASNYPDGAIVEKGGQGYKLRGITPSTRTVKTCSATFASCTALTTFNTTNVTPTMLGLASGDTTQQGQLINWETGQDVDDENGNGVTTTEMRPSAHGDVVHSRPVAINFGTDVSPQVVVFYGDNGGALHAINGNRDGGANVGSAGPGQELWAFVPPEFYPNIKPLRDDTTQISFYGNPTCSTSPCIKKPYGIDGPITSFQGTVGGTAKTFIYTPMRRGGRALYAFDVTTPASPSLKWKIGCPDLTDNTNCTASLTGIGQTWSSAKPLKASGYSSGTSPMLIMGGGYDTCEDADPNTCTASTNGNHIYVLDANTGALLATLNTTRAVVGDVFVISDPTTGLANWAYAADLGGNLYRISGANANTPFASTAPGSWTITKVASLGCATTASCSANRKFMFSPDITLNSDGTYSLIIGSGDREKPLMGFSSAYGVSNYFFMVKDSPTDATWLSSESTNCGGNNVICLASLGHITASNGVISGGTPTMKGWYLDLNPHEQVVTSAITVYGVATFSTHTPSVPVAGTCTANLGTAQVYNIDYSNAASANGTSSVYQVISGGGLPPSPVAGMVTLDNGMTVPFLIGGSADSPLGGGSPTPVTSAARPKGRVYWYIEQ